MVEKTTDGDTEVPRRVLYEQAFKALQQEFASPILDEGFETLHRISKSPTYLDFLRNIYPDIPHQDFKTFVAASVENHPPNAELYRVVLNKHFGRAEKEDRIVIHLTHQAFQNARIRIYHGADKVTVEEEILTPAILEEPVFGWFRKRLRNDKIIEAFDEDFHRLSRDIEFSNIERINKDLKDKYTDPTS